MNNREKVIKGLYQHCEGSMFDRCGKCPYYEVADEPFQCRDALLMDVLALLKSQEPRVMTLEEVEVWRKTDRLERNPIYFEKRGLEFGIWIDPCDDFYDTNTVSYGSDVRCWTARPTDEQRKAVGWE